MIDRAIPAVVDQAPVTAARVVVVVVTFNSGDFLPDLIASLPDGLSGVDWHLVVADNDSRDDTITRLGHLAPSATVVPMGRNAGYAAGINAAVNAAGPHDAVLVLNPDVRLTPGCVRTLLSRLGEPGIGIAVPRLTDRRGELILSMRREPSALRTVGDALLGAERAGRWPALGEVVSDPRRYAVETETDWAEGSTQLISADCWRACGAWDERFFLYSEEADFDLRAGDHGFSTRYVPSAHAVHLEGESAGSPGLWSLLVLNRVRLYRSRHGLLPSALFWLALTAREASRALLGRPVSRAGLRALLSPRRWRQTPGPDAVR